MKNGNQRQGTQDHVPLALNVVNLDGLKLIYRRNSERYSKQKPFQQPHLKKNQTASLKRPQLLTNRIYYKKNKQRQDQLYFSDHRIKLVSGVQPANSFHHLNQTKISIDDPELQSINPDFQQKSNAIFKNQKKDAKVCCDLSSMKYYHPQKNLQNISTSKSLEKNKEMLDQKRLSKTKDQKRRGYSTLKISHSYKNCQKFNIQQRNPHQIDNRLDGWVVQSPLYDIGKKLDITEYSLQGLDDGRNFLSQRAKMKEETRHLKKNEYIRL